jgi:hypothetical protein
MQRRTTLIPLLLTALSTAAVLSAPPASATQRRYRVDDDRRQCRNAEFQTIQAAVTSAPPGAIIEVCPGIYRESVVVNKALTLRGPGSNSGYSHGKGQGHRDDDDCPPNSRHYLSPTNPSKAAILDGQLTLPAGFDLQANNITVEGFTIQRYTHGIRTSPDFSGYRIRRNVLQLSNVGLFLDSNGTLNTRVERNWFNQNNQDASDEEGSGGDGIVSVALSNARIRQNLFTRHVIASMVLAGEEPGDVTNIQVQQNLILDDGSIALFNVTDSEVRQNVSISSVGSGIALGGGNAQVLIRQNSVQGADSDGITLYRDERFVDTPNTNIQVQDNYLRRNQRHGIGLAQTNNNTVERNVLLENGSVLPDNTVIGDGIRLANGATDNLISRNRSYRNVANGIRALALATNNRIQDNVMLDNGIFDARDDSNGTGTAGTANFWLRNECRTENRPGLCEHHHEGHSRGHGRQEHQDHDEDYRRATRF